MLKVWVGSKLTGQYHRKKKSPRAIKCKDTPQSISPSVRKNWKLREYSRKYQMLTFFMYSSSGYSWLADTHTDTVGIHFVFLVIVINTLTRLQGKTWSYLVP